jgi:hypothetical protein
MPDRRDRAEAFAASLHSRQSWRLVPMAACILSQLFCTPVGNTKSVTRGTTRCDRQHTFQYFNVRERCDASHAGAITRVTVTCAAASQCCGSNSSHPQRRLAAMSPSAITVPIHEISIPSAVHGIPPPPQLVKGHGVVSTRAFLNEALLAPGIASVRCRCHGRVYYRSDEQPRSGNTRPSR